MVSYTCQMRRTIVHLFECRNSKETTVEPCVPLVNTDTQKSNFRKPSRSLWMGPEYQRFAVSRAVIELSAHNSQITRPERFLVRSLTWLLRRKVAVQAHSCTHIHSPQRIDTLSDPPRSSTPTMHSCSSSSPYARPTSQQPGPGFFPLTSHPTDV